MDEEEILNECNIDGWMYRESDKFGFCYLEILCTAVFLSTQYNNRFCFLLIIIIILVVYVPMPCFPVTAFDNIYCIVPGYY